MKLLVDNSKCLVDNLLQNVIKYGKWGNKGDELLQNIEKQTKVGSLR